MAVGVDRSGAGFLGHLQQFLHRIAPAKNDFRVPLGVAVLQIGERMVQPPARGAAIGVGLGDLIIQHEHGDDRALLGGFVKGGVISQTQVAPQPDDLGVTHT